MNYYIRIRTQEQLGQVITYFKGRSDVTIMIPVDMESSEINRARAFKLAADLPFVARENKMRKLISCIENADWAQMMVVKNVDELGLLESMDYKGDVIADSFLYAANGQAIAMYREHFPDMTFMASDELTDDESLKMQEAKNLIYKAYGRARVMITAQSLGSNYGSNGANVSIESIKHDRFISADEGFDYSVLYTKDPVSMLDKLEDVPCKNVLADFTLENADETRKVLEALSEGKDLEGIPCGRGHHYKGID